MPQSQKTWSYKFPGISAFSSDGSNNISFVGEAKATLTLDALAAAQCDGELTGRTDDDTGIVTLATGHGIETADVVDVYWAGGVRYGMTATVAANAVTVDGGAGDALPILNTTITAVVEQIDVEINFDGDDAQTVAVFYTNPSDTGAKAHLDLQDVGDASIHELDLVHEKANGADAAICDIANGDTNVYTGNRITQGKATHDSQQAATLYILAGLTAP